MIGQENFIKKLNKYDLSAFPHSALLLGDKGAGHLDVCNYLGERFNISVYDISEMITTEFINQIYLNTDPAIYTVDINKITEKEQNVLLKLLEEPNQLTYLILYGESTYNVLETIINRSYIFNMDRFTREQLEPLVTNLDDKELILKLCSTPGQIEIANHTNMSDLSELCRTMMTSMCKANLANALTITNKINFKDEYDKFDLDMFIKVYSNELNDYKSEHKMEILSILTEFKRYINFMNDKKKYFDNFILKLWGIYRDGYKGT